MSEVNIDLSGIKPLLGQLGLGQAPATTAPPVDNLPPPPMPPPPTPAQAGFTAYSADPRNQQTIANSLTMPGTPITPPNVPDASPLSPTPSPLQPYSPMSQYKPLAMPQTQPPQSAQPLSPAQPLKPYDPMADIQPLTSRLRGDQAEAQRLQSTGSGASQISNPYLRGIAKLGDTAVSILNPRIAAAIPGTTAHNMQLQGAQQGRVGNDQTAIKDVLTNQDTTSQTAQRNAAADLAGTKSDDFSAKTLTKEQAAAINQPDLAGTAMTGRDYAKLVAAAGNNNTSTGNNTRTNDTKVTTTGLNNDSKESIAANRAATQKTMADAANKTRTLIAQMHDSTSRANNENTVSSKVGGPASGGGFKVPADVTKRAALGSNVLENADAVEGIINKRPDIIGAAGGRYSNVQQMIGSDDPDIQALGVRMHNIALASNGAHGVRAQQAIQKTEDELFGNFKAGPNAIKGALGATRASMQTFLNDESNFATTGKRTGGGTAPTPTTSDAAIKVQIPGQPAGTIHASQLASFKAKYPNAKVIQ